MSDAVREAANSEISPGAGSYARLGDSTTASDEFRLSQKSDGGEALSDMLKALTAERYDPVVRLKKV